MTTMLNPHRIKAAYTSIKDLRTMRKEYAPSYSINGRTVKAMTTRFKTATKALEYANTFLCGWRERYDAQIAGMVTASVEPTAVVEVA